MAYNPEHEEKSNKSRYYTNAAFEDDSGDKLDVQWNNVEGVTIKSNTKTSISTIFSSSSKHEKWLFFGGLALIVLCSPLVTFGQEVHAEFINICLERQHPRNGSSTPVYLMPVFGGGRVLENATKSERMDTLLFEDALAQLYVALSLFFTQLILLTFGIGLIKYSAALQVQRIRITLFNSLLRHDMSWHDIHADENFSGKLNEDLRRIEEGLGGTMGLLVFYAGNIITSLLVSACLNWSLTLVVGSIVPLSLFACGLAAVWQKKESDCEALSDSSAGSIMLEATGNIRTVFSFCGEKKEIERFEKQLDITYHHAIRHGTATNLATAFGWMINILINAIPFLYALRSDLFDQPLFHYLMVLLSIWFVILRCLTLPKLVDGVVIGTALSKPIFKAMEIKRDIDPLANDGMQLEKVEGRLEFRNVRFSYPSRPEVEVLGGVTLKINPGQLVAVIGSSGSGKTTLLQLLQRFYDPSAGALFVDGMKMQHMNVGWWRSNIGIVGQEACLFSVTIFENIRFGLLCASKEDVINAAKRANAHDFISKLPMGYDTMLGRRGYTLSGGERQRVAIARALIRDPKILLLDEPTSALDNASREVVEAALKDASKNRTTILVTHRLSSVRTADKIIVMDGGKIIEEGTHQELINLNGNYCNMVKTEMELTDKGNSKVAVSVGNIDELKTEEDAFHLTEDDETEEVPAKVTLKTILSWNKEEHGLIISGFVMAVIAGAVWPVGNILYGDMIAVFSMDNAEDMAEGLLWYSTLLIAVAVLLFLAIFVQLTMFTLARERLSKRIRLQAFSYLLVQEVGWYDNIRNHVGAMYSRISRDVLAIHSAVGPSIAMVSQALTMVFAGILISFYYSWKCALVITALMIPVLAAVLFDLSVKAKKPKDDYLEDASKIAFEIIENKAVVTSLGLEKYFVKKYDETVSNKSKTWLKESIIYALAVSLGQLAFTPAYGLFALFGAYMIRAEDFPFQNIIKICELILFSCILLGTEFALLPGLPQAKRAANRLNILFSRTSKIVGGKHLVVPDIENGNKVKFSEVSMTYPTRPDAQILQSLNLDIKEGQHVAILGPSGSGKSSVLHLLQRLYDPSSGNVSLHSCNINDMTLSTLRRNFGIVSQEPVLFNRSITDNIAYGDNTRSVPMTEIIDAAKAANIHDFIAALPNGYETELGPTTQLSGGQKQRIAIARALVRNPKILLLDEATSALDPEGERSVQRALDNASAGRTTITIAHRLGAVANADHIVILMNGRVVESAALTDMDSGAK